MVANGEPCIHFWKIDTPNGPGGSKGICCRCGEVKIHSNEPIFAEFPNAGDPKSTKRGFNRKSLHLGKLKYWKDVVDDETFGEAFGNGEDGPGNWLDSA